MSIEDVARQFHDTYERLAPDYAWETQVRSRVEWADLPNENRGLMLAVVEEVVGPILAERQELRRALLELQGKTSVSVTEDGWFADQGNYEDAGPDGFPWQPVLQAGCNCHPIDVWFKTEEECRTYIRDVILGKGLTE